MNTAYDFLAGGGEMGALVRAKDWSATPLGPASSWPQSLRTAVSILLNSRYPMFIFWGPGLIKIYNDSYRPIPGDKHPWALGRSGPDVWPEIWNDIGPMVDRVVRGGEATWSEDLGLFMHRRGFPEEVFFTFSYSPIREESGGIGGMFCACTETTAKVLGERRLKLLRELATSTADSRSVSDACDVADQVLRSNAQDIPFATIDLGNRGNWPLGLHRIEELGDRFERAPAGPWPEAPHSCVVLPLPERGLGAPSGVLVLGISSRLPFDEAYRGFFELVAGEVAAAISNARASEKERQRAEALAEIDRAKTAFFSNVSHELRTPLTLMLGPVEDSLTDAQAPLAPVQRERMELARRSGLRLQKLVNTLLDFARIEAGRAQACYEPTDLAALTTDVASSFRSAVEKAGLTLEVDCPPLPQTAYVDWDMWEKIVLNLLSNAFKFTFEGGISLSLKQDRDRTVLEVRDTGTGIAAADLPHIFERFRRVEGARSRTHEGTGIGLALVQELVRLHGGTVRAESIEGKGSTFTVTIPAGKSHLPPERIGAERTLVSSALGAAPYVEESLRWLPAPAHSPIAAGGSSSGRRERIVWADDNADMREYVCKLLGTHYDIEAVANGEDALAAVRERHADLVLADVMMPKLDGFGLIAALRADERTLAIPVILVSARAGEEARIEGVTAGADDYIVKPFSAKELTARVASRLELARLANRQRESEERFRVLLDRAPIGVYVVDADFRIREVNPVALPAFGDIPGGVVGRDFAEIIHLVLESKYADEIVGIFRHTLDTGTPYINAEWGASRIDRDVTEYCEWRVDRIPLPDGRNGVVCYFRDISSQVQARKAIEQSREALRESDRRKDEFIATLSHELRNPLAPLSNAMHLLRLKGNGGGIGAAVRGMMERQVKHLVRLVDDLLDISRINRGTFELRKERVEVATIVKSAVETSEPLIRDAGHHLEVSAPSELLWLDGDPVRLSQILANLLNNAATYTPRGGDISLRVEHQGENVEFVVRDNGAGIAADKLSSIFEMFSRGDAPHKIGHGGLGIGLALARRLIEMHGGTIEARSDGPGKGSEFIVRLALAAAVESEAVHPTRVDAGAAKRRILVVDDNRDAADSLTLVLESLGADVRVARDGREALEAFDSHEPTVVLLDIGMPGMDGYQVARAIRARRSRGRPALVALTGWGQERDRQRAREAGFDHHLVKPADVDALQRLLSSL